MIAYGKCGFCKICDNKTTMIRAVDKNGNYYCQTCYGKSSQQLRALKPQPFQRTAQSLADRQMMAQQRQIGQQRQIQRSSLSAHQHTAPPTLKQEVKTEQGEPKLNEKYPDIRSTIPKYSEIED